MSLAAPHLLLGFRIRRLESVRTSAKNQVLPLFSESRSRKVSAGGQLSLAGSAKACTKLGWYDRGSGTPISRSSACLVEERYLPQRTKSSAVATWQSLSLADQIVL